MLDDLLARFRAGDRLALTRLLSLASRTETALEVGSRLPPPSRPARIVAVTGNAGVGKSTLVGKLIDTIRSAGLKVAVLACDPQSPLSGGALLGDRFRMPARPDDDGVLIRSLATAGGRGAIAEHLDVMVRLLEAFGFDVVLIETVGAGQGDTAVRELADVVVLLLQPETGDDLQWEKAGVLEVADVIVIHKADLPGADRVEGQVKAMLGLSHRPAPPVLRVSSRSGQGLEALWSAIAGLPLRRGAGERTADDLEKIARETLTSRFAVLLAQKDVELQQLLASWQSGGSSDRAAVAGVFRILGRDTTSHQ